MTLYDLLYNFGDLPSFIASKGRIVFTAYHRLGAGTDVYRLVPPSSNLQDWTYFMVSPYKGSLNPFRINSLKALRIGKVSLVENTWEKVSVFSKVLKLECVFE